MNMLRRCVQLFLVVLLICPAVWAKPKVRVFNAPSDRVFQAALKAAREHHVIQYMDEKNLNFSFHTGTSATSWGFDCSVSVEPAGTGKSKLIPRPENPRPIIRLGRWRPHRR